MTFVAHRAERADVLARVLADILAAPPADAFTPEVVAVHSRGVERWLAHRLSAHLGTAPGRADGVCANLRFPFPGRLVQDTLATVTGIDPKTDPWRPERLAWPLLDVVDECLHEDWLFVLAGHLGGAGSPEEAGEDIAERDRRFAAVRHLADLYDRYAVHRPEMVLAWAEGADHDGDGAPLGDAVRWQAELWRRLRARVDRPSPAERAADGCAALATDPHLVDADLPERLFLFGLTRLPASYFEVLHALAAHRDVHLLALHPSPAAWATETLDDLQHPLLRAWSRDSFEMGVVLRRRLGAAGTGGATSEDVHHPVPVAVEEAAARAGTVAEPSLLHRLQDAIRADTAPLGPTDDERPLLAADDRSVQVHACHGRARQAEVLRDALTHLFADDPTLEPRDVVVMCPDIDEMASLLRAAFDDDPDDPRTIPYRLADRSLRQTNPVLGAMAELIALVDARLTASQILAFAALPPVRQRFGFDEDDLDRLAEWVGQTGIRWGLDAEHRASYDLASVATGTWAAGLDRVLVGVAMSEDHLRLVGGVLPLDDVDSGDIDLAGRVAELITRLGRVVRSLCDPRPVAEWVAALNEAAELLFDTRWEDGWQRTQLDRLLADVSDEAGGDGPDRSGARTSLRLAEVRDLLADRLRGQPSRAAFRTGDVTMCTLVPMRSVPHRVVCLVGLDDGAFPRGGAPDGDDLLVAARHPGDHDRRAEDRQLLLDAVLAAGDHLVITYTGQDPRTNEPVPPAVPVSELLDAIEGTVRTADARPAPAHLVQHHPLQPADPRCFEPGALGTDGPWSFDRTLLAGAAAAIRPQSTPPPFLAGPLPPPPRGDVVELADLVAFLQHPVKAFLRQRLELSVRSYDDLAEDSLAIDIDGLGRWAIGDRILTALLEGGDPDTVCAAEVARGLLPHGQIGTQALTSARAGAEAVAAAARRVADGLPTSLEVDVALTDGRHLVGVVPDVIGATVRPVTFSKLRAKQRLGAWAHHLAASAAHPDLGLTTALVGSGRREPDRFRLPPLTRDEATSMLEDLVALRDEGLREPLPLPCATARRFAEVDRVGAHDPVEAADKEWTSGFDWDKEDRDPEHVLAYGEGCTLEQLLADGRFATYARRLWRPIFDAVQRASSHEGAA